MLNASINVATSGDNTIIPGVAGRRIRVVNFMIVAAAAVAVFFRSGTGGTAFQGAMTMTTGVPFQSGYGAVRGNGATYDGHWDGLAQGDSLVLNLSANVQVSGYMDYILVP